MNGRGVSESGTEADLASLGRSLWAKRAWLFGPAIVTAILATIAVNVVTPRYKSETRILIETRDNAFLRPEADKANDRTLIDMEAIASQVQILTSRDLALQVIRELKLTERPEFDPVLRGVSISGTFLSLIGLGKDPLRLTPEERTLESFYDRLTVLPVEKSRVITVEFQSSDAQLSARVANAIADAYLAFQQSAKQDQTRGASQWLATEIEKLRDRVAEAEQKVEDYRAKANLYVGTNNATLAAQQLTDLTTQLAAARGQKADLDAKSRLIREMLKSGKPVESADIVNSELLRRLVEQRVTLRAQLAEQSSTLMQLHPRIQELTAQGNALDTQIRGELEKLVRSIENDARIAGARIETTSAAADQLKRQISATSGQDVQLRALDREAKAQRDLLESYLAKYREASARDSIDAAPADARIISRAVASNLPVYPKKIPVVLLATIAVLFLAATFIMTGVFLDGGSAVVATRGTGPATAWTMPGLARLRGLFGKRRAPVRAPAAPTPAPSVRLEPATRTIEGLVQMLRDAGAGGGRVAVIGATRNVGTTYTAIGLARALAGHGRRVVLVDLAVMSPNLSVLSSNPQAPGLAEFVRGEASLGEIITRDRFSKVQLVTTGRIGGDARGFLDAPRIATTLGALARAYDHVVIDGGAATDVAPAQMVQYAPCAVLVATAATHAAAKAARERMSGFRDVALYLANPQDERAAVRPAA